jgi:hypothetical protein
VATVDDAIEFLRDPLNLTNYGDPSDGLGVRTPRVVALLRGRGAESEQEALGLIRQATRALGGGEVIVRRPGALGVDKLGSEPRRPEPAFWVPGAPRRGRLTAPSAPPRPSRSRRFLRKRS